MKKEAEELGINLKELIERTLADEIMRIRKERLRALIRKALESMDVTPEEWARLVRETRREG